MSTPNTLKADFNRGLNTALDPSNEIITQQQGQAITSRLSPWLHRHCEVCGHTFRHGDQVYVYDDGRVVHDSVLLPCTGGESSEQTADSQATTDFFRGMDETWPPPKDLPVMRLEHGHILLAPPHAGFKRHACAVCGHTLRPHDTVIICPCQPHDPMCQVAIHRDPLHNLLCWSLWGTEEGNRLQHCLATSRQLFE